MGNFSRNTFNKLKHYVGVRLQQGIPIVDADWNELEDIRKYELQAFLKWFVGNGVPRGNDGFRILPLAADNDFAIQGGDGTAEGAGRCLVEGWDVINESTLNYTAQPLFNNPALATKWGVAPVPPLTTPTTDRTDAVYVDIWEREVDAEEDTELVNPAIGIETCVRRKREWVVRVAEGASQPPQPPGHVFYRLASVSRKANQPVVGAGDITDLRQIGLNIAALEAEITAARGIKANLGNRLEESLTEGGELRPNVVGSDQIKDSSVGTTKLADGAITTPKIADDAVNNTNVAPNSLFYDKLRRSSEIIESEITMAANGTGTVDVGAPDAFRLVSVYVTNGQVDWHFRSGISFPSPIPKVYVVLQNNGGASVTVRVRAYVFADPG